MAVRRLLIFAWVVTDAVSVDVWDASVTLVGLPCEIVMLVISDGE